MPKNNKKEWFDWKWYEWSMGEVLVKKHLTNSDGSETLKLEVLIPKKMGTPSRIKKLIAKNYKSVLITPDKGNTNFLQLSFTNIKV